MLFTGKDDGAKDLIIFTHPTPPTPSPTPLRCAVWLTTPLLLVSRWDPTNPYQHHQDLLNAFRVLAATGLPATTHPILLDTRARDGPFVAAWAGGVFGGAKRVVGVREVTALVGETNGMVCVKTAVWGVHGGISPLARGGTKPETCEAGSPLLRAFASFVGDRVREGVLGDSAGDTMLPGPLESESGHPTPPNPPPTAATPPPKVPIPVPQHLALPDGPGVIKVTYAIRRSRTRTSPLNSTSPLDAFLDGFPDLVPTGSTTTADAAARLAARKARLRKDADWDTAPSAAAGDLVLAPGGGLHRTLPREPQLVRALNTTLGAWTPPTGSGAALFRAVDFAKLSWEAQMAIAADTDVLVAPHGAVLIHTLYLRRFGTPAPGVGGTEETVEAARGAGGVVELVTAERAVGNFQFRNLAGRVGVAYARCEMGGRGEVGRAVGEVVGVVEEVWRKRWGV
ncbi:hypothetical protein HDU96_003087 [Phlyctochytrium bullatum]|nr:hypothetical protein HDU96_003087 [Phlyctochytrium bullatum]